MNGFQRTGSSCRNSLKRNDSSLEIPPEHCGLCAPRLWVMHRIGRLATRPSHWRPETHGLHQWGVPYVPEAASEDVCEGPSLWRRRDGKASRAVTSSPSGAACLVAAASLVTSERSTVGFATVLIPNQTRGWRPPHLVQGSDSPLQEPQRQRRLRCGFLSTNRSRSQSVRLSSRATAERSKVRR
jgi:hypothetical protein